MPKSHGAKFRYKSSDTSIATVSKKGKIKGIKKGKCTIYVYSINGLVKKARITVK
ncbi:MAG: Ig-like domain-containing protein [Lachnospiraceae bacterium]|nr:Ig-like domain-containing protein [Lachnospiraceae bacterium]